MSKSTSHGCSKFHGAQKSYIYTISLVMCQFVFQHFQLNLSNSIEIKRRLKLNAEIMNRQSVCWSLFLFNRSFIAIFLTLSSVVGHYKEWLCVFRNWVGITKYTHLFWLNHIKGVLFVAFNRIDVTCKTEANIQVSY